MDVKQGKGLTPRQTKRRATILRTVREQLRLYGYDELSMRKIAAAASVSPSTLYEIYGSKESLILYAIGDSIDSLSSEESKYEPGLDRFLHRLESIANLFIDDPGRGEAIATLFFEHSEGSIANEILLVNAINARKTSLEEMLAQKQLIKGIDLDFYARTLVSITWGTALLWLKGMLDAKDFRNELVRSSLALLLSVSTGQAKKVIQSVVH